MIKVDNPRFYFNALPWDRNPHFEGEEAFRRRFGLSDKDKVEEYSSLGNYLPYRNAEGMWCRIEHNDTDDIDFPPEKYRWQVILYNEESDCSTEHCTTMKAVRKRIKAEGFVPSDVAWCIDTTCDIPDWYDDNENK